MKLVVASYSVRIECANCGNDVVGWIYDPRGAINVECEDCGKTFDIPEDCEIEIQ